MHTLTHTHTHTHIYIYTKKKIVKILGGATAPQVQL